MNSRFSALATDNSKSCGYYYAEYQQELCRYAVQKFGLPYAEAEDVVQTVFTRFTEKRGSAEIDNVRAFLYRAVNNAVVDLMRHHQVCENHGQIVQLEFDEEDVVGPERVVIGRQFLAMITHALWAMPGKRRRLLIMNRVDGLSYAEIARREGLSETVVRKHISKALAGCQKALHAGAGEQ